MRIAAVAEDGFDEIEVGDEGPRGKEADLHRFGGLAAGRRADRGAEKEGNEKPGRVLLVGGEREGEKVRRGGQRRFQQGREGAFGDGLFVGGNRETALDDMENALGGAAVTDGIVEDSLGNAVGAEARRGETGAFIRKGENPAKPGAIENERRTGEARDRIAEFAKIGVEEGLDAGVRRTEIVLQEPDLVLVVPEKRPGDVDKVVVAFHAVDRLPHDRQFQRQVAEKFC